MENNYLGIMVWYASVDNNGKPGLQYGGGSWDASEAKQTQDAYMRGMKRFRSELWVSCICKENDDNEANPSENKILIKFNKSFVTVYFFNVPNYTGVKYEFYKKIIRVIIQSDAK